jgi:hypothetical protein
MRCTLPILLLSLALAAVAPRPASALAPATLSAPASPLPWIVDDWPRALSLAKARKVPIFVENWAPW